MIVYFASLPGTKATVTWVAEKVFSKKLPKALDTLVWKVVLFSSPALNNGIGKRNFQRGCPQYLFVEPPLFYCADF